MIHAKNGHRIKGGCGEGRGGAGVEAKEEWILAPLGPDTVSRSWQSLMELMKCVSVAAVQPLSVFRSSDTMLGSLGIDVPAFAVRTRARERAPNKKKQSAGPNLAGLRREGGVHVEGPEEVLSVAVERHRRRTRLASADGFHHGHSFPGAVDAENRRLAPALRQRRVHPQHDSDLHGRGDADGGWM